MSFQQKAIRRAVILAAALMITAVVNCSVTPINVSAASQIKGTVTADALNVRKGPGKTNAIINVIYRGESVTITKTDNGWYKIKLDNSKVGWVSSDFVKTSGKSKTTTTTSTAKSSKTATASKTKTPDKTNGTFTVIGSYTNLRKGAGAGYGIIKRMYYGTTGSILQKDGSWYKVKLEDAKVGWVYKKYIKVSNYKAQVISTSKADKITVDVSSVNVRSKASTSGKIVATIRQNEVYRYSEVKNGWYKIVTPSGESGYVNGNFVEKFSGYAINGGGKYIWPTQTAKRITTYFGTHNGKTHYGIDIAAPGGSQIIAVADGKVSKISYNPDGFGHLIVIEQNDGIMAYYAHMQKASFLKKGDKVKAGDTIGIVGSTGKSTGNHLHLEFRKNGKRIDPLDYYPNID